ncbi:DUF2805 domain-containing protein [Hymenobacter sp. IS2118]|uniref:DUF2805 domain-containing protein n=1 Tax=Hymenobacter sp. IS2118 TaxID=1505605 RepID=UPI00090763F6|nr:DUF2805 domain-containing protein [Hymenobacter sp. IS2118]
MKTEPTDFNQISGANSARVIEIQFGLAEKDVIELMHRSIKASSFRLWRKRMAGRTTKH